MRAEDNPSSMSAAVFCAEIPLTEESVRLMTEGMSVPQFLDTLIAQQRWTDAVQVLARMIPARESVWWACQCVAHSVGRDTRPQETLALHAAETWVGEMTEESRYAAYEAAQEARLGTPANCVAMAAFVSGPSLAPRDSDPIPPTPGFGAQLVAATVLAAGVAAGGDQFPDRLRYFLEQGKAMYQQIAGGIG